MKLGDLNPWRPAVAWHCPQVLWAVGVLCTVLYALCRVMWPQLGSPAETATAVLGLVALLVWGRGLRRSAAIWLLLAAIAVQVLSWGLGYYHHPQWIDDNPQIDRLAKLFIFIALAWWLGGSTRNTLLLWSLALVAFLAALFVQGNGLPEWWLGLQGTRVDFNIRNAQHTSMFFGSGLLGLVAFSHRSIYRQRLVVWRLALWSVAVTLCLAGIVITQTRAVWLALVIALPVMGGLWLWAFRRRQDTKITRRNLVTGAAALVVLGIGTGDLAYDTVETRLEQERAVIEMLASGDIAEVPYSSIGIRVQTWRAASEWIAERPLVGWGSDGRSLAIDQTAWLPEEIKQQFGHLHNYFLEVWVAYGVLGLAVFIGLAAWVGRATWLAWRGGVMPGDMALFGAAFFVFWVIVNQFESYNSFWTGVYVHNLVLGGLVTHYWRWQLTGGSDSLGPERMHHAGSEEN
ncbi:hypothetical protein GCM10027040_24170 [Halomonas shantousis]